MAYDMTFKDKWLRKSKDDVKKAQALDAAYESFTEPLKELVDELYFIGAKLGMGVNGAKAFAANLILFLAMKPDEQDRWVAHGKAIQAEYNWACVGKMKKQIEQELDEELEVQG